ncbi:MAG: hypothetical protein ACR2QS_16875 [Woeseiaceae bacterium]
MTRARLFSLRISATLCLLLPLFVVVRTLWYPSGYFEIFGVGKLLLIVAVAALVAGPVLSAVVYKPGKKSLVFDLLVLACIEIVIVGWGTYEIAERRPVYTVFAVDRFEAVAAGEVDAARLRYTALLGRSATAPRLIYAELPTDVDAMNRLIDETVLYGMADIDRRPEFWKPYPQGMPALKQAAIPLRKLLVEDGLQAAMLRDWLQQRSLRAADYLFLPIRGSKADGTVILHADVGYPVDVIAVDPW